MDDKKAIISFMSSPPNTLGMSKIAGLFLYLLVTMIGMSLDISQVADNPGIFVLGKHRQFNDLIVFKFQVLLRHLTMTTRLLLDGSCRDFASIGWEAHSRAPFLHRGR